VTNRIDPAAGAASGQISVTPVAVVRSPFRERFGIPRQPGLAEAVPGRLHFLPPYNRAEAVAGLEAFSHLWLVFGFHANPDAGPALTVRPPRLGGNERVGVFASRSPYRPNPIGLSVVRLEALEPTAAGPVLHLRGVDLLLRLGVLRGGRRRGGREEDEHEGADAVAHGGAHHSTSTS
jgi:tRNA-Thr(GGU) m(6)t(6)A37 methyltransferase TsaA